MGHCSSTERSFGLVVASTSFPSFIVFCLVYTLLRLSGCEDDDVLLVFAEAEGEQADVSNGFNSRETLREATAAIPDAVEAVAEPRAVDDDSIGVAVAVPVPEPIPGHRRQQHADSFRWGHFYFTWSTAATRPPHGGWAVVCPYHAKNSRTSCSKSMALPTSDSKERVQSLLKLWCLQADGCVRKSDHASVRFKNCDVPPAATLDARLGNMPPPPDRALLIDDEARDALEAAQAVKILLCNLMLLRRGPLEHMVPQSPKRKQPGPSNGLQVAVLALLKLPSKQRAWVQVCLRVLMPAAVTAHLGATAAALPVAVVVAPATALIATREVAASEAS